MPTALASRPVLDPEDEPFLEAWLYLSPSRGEYGYIPPSEIKAYVDLMGVDDVPALLRIIRAMDVVWVKCRDEKRAADEKANDPKRRG